MNKIILTALVTAIGVLALLTAGKSFTQDSAISFGVQQGTVPRGAVMAFNSETCPFLWKNFGSAGGRVIVGLGAAFVDGESTVFGTLRQSGGKFEASLSSAQLPAHAHTAMGSAEISSPGPDSTVLCTGAPQCTNSSHSHGFSGLSDPHRHIGTTGVTGSAGAGSAVSIVQPYIVLRYCEFTGLPALDVVTE